MTDADRTEILAQAIWRGQFGEIKILPEWTAFAANNTEEATNLRAKASDMIAAASQMPGFTSLSWLMNG